MFFSFVSGGVWERPTARARTISRAKSRLWFLFFVWNNSFLGTAPHKCVDSLQPISFAENSLFFLPYTKYASEKLPFSGAKSLAECSPPIYVVLPETKKGPCIQSIGDGYRGLGDNLCDQRNAVIFSENAKKPSLNVHSDWALRGDMSRWGVRIKKYC